MSKIPPLTLSLILPTLILWMGACASQVGIRDGNSVGNIVLYSGRSETLVGPIVQQFEEATGVDVSVKYGGTSALAATLLEEGTNTKADVFFAQDPGGLTAVTGILGLLPDELVQSVPSWARSSDNKWVGISGRARVVAYNISNLTEDDLPESIWGFTETKWKGRIGWPPGNASFQSMVTAMRVMWGEDKTREWLQGIQANNPKVYPNNTPAVAATAAGEVDVAFVNHYYLYRFLSEEGQGFAARNHNLKAGGPGSLMLVSGAGILEASENRDAAETFLRFMLSEVAQQYFTTETYEYPLVTSVNITPVLTPLSDINNAQLDMNSLSDIEATQSLLRELDILQ